MKPILLQLGPIPLRSYGAMMMIGFLIGLYRAVRVARKKGIDPSHVMDAALFSLLSGIVGSRLIFVLLNWGTYRHNLGGVLNVWEGGLSFHGGILFGIGAVYAYVRYRKIPFLQMADLLAPSLAIAYGFTRIGCFLNGCCFGIPTNLPWCVHFPDSAGCVHPTQLYSSAASFLIYVALTRIDKWNKPQGFAFASYIAMYSVYRFLVEILRKGVTAEVWFWGLTEAQVVSVVMFVGAMWALRRLAATMRS